MSARPPAPRPQGWWLGYAGFIVVCAGLVFQGGIQSAQIKQNAADIAVLKASDAARVDIINQMNIRGTRVETKLDYLVEHSNVRK